MSDFFATATRENLIILTDFDGTLTPYYASGKINTTQGMIRQVLGGIYQKRARALFERYRPLEQETQGAQHDRLMKEWWTKSHNLLRASEFNHAHAQQVAERLTAYEDITFLNNFDFIILSAGIGDSIKEFCDIHELLPEEIISNFFTAGDHDLIYAANKDLSHLKDASILEGKTHVMILGDNNHDLNVSRPYSFEKTYSIGISAANSHLKGFDEVTDSFAGVKKSLRLITHAQDL